ncbi:uncharacterized protein Dmoj_GI26128, isoform A [Drosophila mojavensis]|uniref:Uncharacterized protein, isoform A n=1 Tax=Drosophila mojavensis TaxID=7230 RepID=A0A0Q9XVF7_DROMO|nr:uncharacterized protein Dmoj_GI26128, isoform A [Drosophila mojavensis]
MGRRNLKAQLLLNGRASPAKNMQPVSAASATSAAAARKLPELITAQQLKKLDISLLIQYYVINLRYPHNERPTM